uniref:Uncharacterized protein n=1 Tax=Wuchereria bancrofti TaxID=6293 RepID=A0AAF5Q2E5_WUCBA
MKLVEKWSQLPKCGVVVEIEMIATINEEEERRGRVCAGIGVGGWVRNENGKITSAGYCKEG